MKEHYQGPAHIAIHTPDLDASIAFYEKIGGALRQKDALPTPAGAKGLALVEFGGFELELIQSPTPAPLTEGNIPHFAVYVDDVDAAAAARGLGTTRALSVVLLGAAARAGALGLTADDLAAAVRDVVAPRFVDLDLAALATRWDRPIAP